MGGIVEPSSYPSLNSQESTPPCCCRTKQTHQEFFCLPVSKAKGTCPGHKAGPSCYPQYSQKPKASLWVLVSASLDPETRQRDMGMQQTVHWGYPGCWQSPGSSITSLWSFLPKSIHDGQKKACPEAAGSLLSTWSFAPGVQLELSPFFGIKEGFSKRVVFNFKGCNLKKTRKCIY